MRKSGLIEIDSIKGGNIYGSLEGKLARGGHKVVEITLLKISEWMQTEQTNGIWMPEQAMIDMEDEHLISPDGEYSTEFGEVPHEDRERDQLMQRKSVRALLIWSDTLTE